jgi:putative ABC transport system substrate-binding protein
MKHTPVGLLVLLALSLLSLLLAAEAQQATKVHRIGRLASGPSLGPNPILEAFRQGLRELGYVEGQNFVIDGRYAEGREERLPDLAAELVRLQVDIIVVGGSAAIRAAQHATRTIPIVMAVAPDPEESGCEYCCCADPLRSP